MKYSTSLTFTGACPFVTIRLDGNCLKLCHCASLPLHQLPGSQDGIFRRHRRNQSGRMAGFFGTVGDQRLYHKRETPYADYTCASLGTPSQLHCNRVWCRESGSSIILVYLGYSRDSSNDPRFLLYTRLPTAASSHHGGSTRIVHPRIRYLFGDSISQYSRSYESHLEFLSGYFMFVLAISQSNTEVLRLCWPANTYRLVFHVQGYADSSRR
jgi:hypothetical protein